MTTSPATVIRTGLADTAPVDAAQDEATAVYLSLTAPERFGDVFDRHFADIHQYVARRLGAEVADDLTAETFLAAFRLRGRYRPDRGPVRAWLYGIATNLMRRHRRSEVRAWRAWSRTGVDPVTDCHSQQVSDRVSAGSLSGRLAGALAGLAARDREVLLLVAWGQLRYDEVAAALGIPMGTVASRLNRARRKIRAALPDLESHE